LDNKLAARTISPTFNLPVGDSVTNLAHQLLPCTGTLLRRLARGNAMSVAHLCGVVLMPFARKRESTQLVALLNTHFRTDDTRDEPA
ncbi:MAG: hypothetical protein P8Z79_18105, partial [Sedimentisphaerales bacterium]